MALFPQKVQPMRPNFRVAFRSEGNKWVAYCAQVNTMDGAVIIGSMILKATSNPDRKKQFMDLMQNVVADMVEGVTTERPILFQEVKDKPKDK